jgi:hypothetical protein
VEFSQVIDRLSLPFESNQQARRIREFGRALEEEELDSEEYESPGSIGVKRKVDKGKGKLRIVDSGSSDPDPPSAISSDPDPGRVAPRVSPAGSCDYLGGCYQECGFGVVRQSAALEDQ